MRAHVLIGVAIAAGATTARAQSAPDPTQPISPPGMSGPTVPPQPGFPSPAFDPVVLSPPAKPPSAMCLIGRALPDCANILVVETLLSVRDDGAWSGSFEGGVLVNQGRHNAWGVSLGVVDTSPPLLRPLVSDDTMPGKHTFMVAHARYRRWLTNWLGVDASVGGGYFGPDGQAAIEVGDFIAVVASASTLPDPTGGKLEAAIGIRIGAPALIGLLMVLTGTSG
jgi:hypothetical protein